MSNIQSMETISETAAQWLEARGLDMETVVRLSISSKPAHGTGEEIVIPFIVEGQVIGRKYKRINGRPEDNDWRFDPGFKGEVFWNQQALDDKTLKKQPLIITEGEWDCIAALQCGYTRSVSMPNGAGNLAVLDSQFEKLDGVDQIIIAADGDSAGANLQREMLRRFGKARCKLLKYPKGCKDLNDALKAHGPAGVTETIRRAEFAPMPTLCKISDLPDVKERKIYKSGLSHLFDKHVSFCRGMTSVWTGYPGHGKSTLLSQAHIHLSKAYDWRHAIKAFEDDYRLDFRPRAGAQLYRQAPETLTAEQWSRVDQFLDDHFLIIAEPEGMAMMTHDWLMDHMEAAVRRYGVQSVSIDPWTMIQDGGNARSEVEQQKNDLGRWVTFARRSDVHLSIVAHPRKQESDDQIPVGRDISGSAHWFNMIDLGVSCWRPEKPEDNDSDCKIKVWKVKRQQTMGPLGTFGMDFHAPSHTFQQPYTTRRDEAA